MEQPLVHIDISLLADEVSKTPPDTFDGGESEHDLLLTVHIGVQNTQNVLKFLVRNQRLERNPKRNKG